MYVGRHVTYPSFLSDFNDTSLFSKDFLKILKYQISRKSVQRELSSSTWKDKQTDAMKLIVTFRNFANTPKNVVLSFCEHILLGADRWNTRLVLKSYLLTLVEQKSPGTTPPLVTLYSVKLLFALPRFLYATCVRRKKNTGSIYDCTVNDVITSYMHTIKISSHQRYSRMIKGAHSLRSNK